MTTSPSAASSSAVSSSAASSSASCSGNATTAAPSSTSGVVLITTQSVQVSGNQTRTVNVTLTSAASRSSSSSVAANLTTAETPAGFESGITALAPGATASGVAVGPDDNYIAAAGRVDAAVWAGAGAALLGVAALF
ncbi:hypothetical protein JCM10213v2_000403 [Rhodosporidiobolus nylandii]